MLHKQGNLNLIISVKRDKTLQNTQSVKYLVCDTMSLKVYLKNLQTCAAIMIKFQAFGNCYYPHMLVLGGGICKQMHDERFYEETKVIRFLLTTGT